jgi:hypothetical protein
VGASVGREVGRGNPDEDVILLQNSEISYAWQSSDPKRCEETEAGAQPEVSTRRREPEIFYSKRP